MRVVGKWKQLGSFVEAVDRKRLAVGVMRHIERRYDAEPLGPERFRPFQEADGIVEYVMLPVDTGRLGFDLQRRAVQAKVMAFVRPDHQFMTQQAHRIAVDVFGRMHDTYLRHASLT